MRPSKRRSILDAANRVAERDGVAGVTIESVADEAGMSKGGVVYHFSTKESLMKAVQEHLAESWETAMTLDAGKSADEASLDERVAAYARVATMSSSSSADLAFILENTKRGDSDDAAWADVAYRWSPTPEEAAADAHALELFIVRLAADGLWAFESLQQGQLDSDFRKVVAQRIAAMIPNPPFSADQDAETPLNTGGSEGPVDSEETITLTISGRDISARWGK